MRKQLIMALSTSLLTACATLPGATADEALLSGRVLIAGDSTAADYPRSRAPQIGWGQVIDYYLSEDVTVLNRAVNGRSTKSYIDEGKWASLLAEVGEGDVVFISFGHNDSRDDAPERYAAANGAYRENMARFARDVKAKGGFPIILSSPARRLWEGPAMVETHGPYRINAELAAEDSGADFVDLAQLSMDYFETLGQAETRKDYLWLTAEEVAEQLPAYAERYPDGLEDNTHFKEIGACGVARIIAGHLDQIFPQLVNEHQFDPRLSDEAGRPADVVKCAARAWDVDVSAQEPELSGRIFLTGDSTASEYRPEYAPRTGWGQVFGHYVRGDVEVINLAADERSTKTYNEEGR